MPLTVASEWIGEAARLAALPLRWLSRGLSAGLDLIPSRETASDRGSGGAATGRPSGSVAFERDVVTRQGRPPTTPRTERKEPGPRASPPLPLAGGDDRLIVLARSPETAFAFWAVSGESLRRARGDMNPSGATLELRIRATQENRDDRTVIDRAVVLPPGATSAYLADLPERSRLEVTVGLANAGRFVGIASSTIPTLARTLDDDTHATWREHVTGRTMPGYADVGGKAPAPSDELACNLPPALPTGDALAVVTPAPNPRAVPARR